MSERARVLYLDPYHTASHRALAEALRDRSRHDVTLLSLPPRKWKWRMRGAALAFEPQVRALAGPPAGVLVTTDFLNLPEFLALTRDHFPSPLGAIVFFHENQLTYPTPSSDLRDIHFGLANLYTALAADRVVFNSEFHRDSFVAGAEELVRLMPDFRPERIAPRLLDRASVLGLPLDLAAMDAARRPERQPWILWNHRWEEDRAPGEFFTAMETLAARARRGEAPDFRLVVVGQTYRTKPAIFDAARGRLAQRIERWGFVESRREYLELVSRCAVVVSTSRHEFFGVSVMEAIHLGCLPILPRRLAYPALAGGDDRVLYDDPAEIPDRAAALLSIAVGPREEAETRLAPMRERIRAHDLPGVVSTWDRWIAELASTGSISAS
ncbi:MAG: DUF3524 domain-containing protein [Acidobacteria bacterium]|nr:DUF3524 domain-containing protein [Acidobacteriota bacterium]